MRAQELALATIDALHALNWDYLLVGGLAAIQHGITRTTYDVDIVLATESLNIAPLVRQLGPGFVIEEQRTFEVFTAKSMQVILLPGTALRIDCFPLGKELFDQEQFRRRRKLLLEGREVFMPTAEDVVVQKLRWGRTKDAEDARFILAVQGDALDFAYIERWCDQHGTRALLDKLRSEIPPE
jgi:Nucleotidyltransferase of unknown function (DUF6036)